MAPTSGRMRGAPLSDLRLWAGVALVVGSMVIGATVLSPGDDTVTVWRAGRDLSAGAPATGLVPVSVERSVAADHYAGPGADVTGILRWPVAAGELIPRAALSDAPMRETRGVTIPVDPLHAPPDLQPGDVVDVWSTPRDATAGEAAPAAPSLVLPEATVIGIAGADTGISGELGVVLDVPDEAVGAVVAAGRAGVTDLVAVPMADQAVRS